MWGADRPGASQGISDLTWSGIVGGLYLLGLIVVGTESTSPIHLCNPQEIFAGRPGTAGLGGRDNNVMSESVSCLVSSPIFWVLSGF